MQADFGHLVVGRDRAHVRTLLEEHPHCDVISASHFFDKVRMLQFLYDGHVVRDDYAPLIIAQRHLVHDVVFPPRFAKNFASLFSSCFHGVARPCDVLDKLAPHAEKFHRVFSVLHAIDETMDGLHLTTGVRALYRALLLMRTRSTLPPLFSTVTRVSLYHLVDLTLLEIAVIKELSRLGVPFAIHFPLAQGHGVNTAVNFTAAQFERDYDLANIEIAFVPLANERPLSALQNHLFGEGTITLSHQVFSLHRAPTLTEEADHIAEKILSIIAAKSDARIAVVVRTMDARAELFKRALMRYGISVRDRKGISLLKSQAGVLLMSLFSARRWGLPKSDVVGLINHPLFTERVADGAVRSNWQKLIDELGVDDRMVDDGETARRYRQKTAMYGASPVLNDEQKATLAAFCRWLSDVEAALALLPKQARLKDFLQAVVLLVDRTMLPDAPSVEAVKKALAVIAESTALEFDDGIFALNDLISWLKTELSSLTMPRPDHPDVHAVEFLLLPEMLGRHFEHVFIADMAFGRLPQAPSPDIVLDDKERCELNRIMERPFLRIYYEDPFEPLPTPPRQALEPLWLASAIAAAQISVHCSVADRDEREQEQAAGEFFLWLQDHVVVDTSGARDEQLWKNSQRQRFLRALHDKDAQPASPYQRALTERKQGFLDTTVGEFSFSLEPERVLEAFAGRLGPTPHRALSPTMIEAFADCRLRGWLLRMMNLDGLSKDPDDIDARAIGRIAHSALERFFEKRERDDSEDITARLRTITDDAIADYIKTNYVSNPGVLICHQEWLIDALGTLIGHLEHERLCLQATTVLKESDFGLGDKKRPPVMLAGRDHRYLVGGRIDRVDQTSDGFLIIDYKLSSADSLKAKLSPRNVLKGNFQAPIYLRLVAHHVAHEHDVAFAFASIRDGELLPPFARAGNEETFERIFDDHKPESLAENIDDIFAPIMRGEIAATPGEHCAYCEFAFVCRRGEWEHHGC